MKKTTTNNLTVQSLGILDSSSPSQEEEFLIVLGWYLAAA